MNVLKKNLKKIEKFERKTKKHPNKILLKNLKKIRKYNKKRGKKHYGK